MATNPEPTTLGPLEMMGHIFHDIAKSKGWWDDPARDLAASAVALEVEELVATWGTFISPNDYRRAVLSERVRTAVRAVWPERNVGELMMLLVSEIAEAFEEYRDGHFDEIYFDDTKTPSKPEGGPIELADLIIRLIETAAQRGMNLDEAVRIKAAYNRTRPRRHGGKLA